MGPVEHKEPQSATEYDDRTTKAVRRVLLEIGQILGSFKGKFAVIGGAVPWLLLNNEEMPHVGTLDVDHRSSPSRWTPKFMKTSSRRPPATG